jgi:hypothetical protein
MVVVVVASCASSRSRQLAEVDFHYAEVLGRHVRFTLQGVADKHPLAGKEPFLTTEDVSIKVATLRCEVAQYTPNKVARLS